MRVIRAKLPSRLSQPSESTKVRLNTCGYKRPQALGYSKKAATDSSVLKRTNLTWSPPAQFLESPVESGGPLKLSYYSDRVRLSPPNSLLESA